MPASRRNQVTDVFGTVAPPDRVITAFYINPDTNEKRKVQIPGTPHIEGHHYFSKYEAQFLFADEDGKTKLRYHPARPSRGGSSGAQVGGYFSPEDTTPLRKKKSEPVKRAKAQPFTGYRISIDTAEYSPTFNQKSGVYDVSEHGLLSNPKKGGRLQPVRVGTIKEIVDLIRFGEPKKLVNSEVVFQNNDVTWGQFCIRMGTPSRQRELLERLQQRKAGQEPPFALVEIRTTGRHSPKPDWTTQDPKKRGKVPRAPVDKIRIGTSEDNKAIYIRYDVYIDDQRADKNATDSLYAAGTYFVLAEVRHKKQQYKGEIVHYLNMKVTNRDQIMPVNIENLDRDSRMSPAEKRAMKESEKPKPITLPAFIDPYPLTGE